jgi:hypothetical protein
MKDIARLGLYILASLVAAAIALSLVAAFFLGMCWMNARG